MSSPQEEGRNEGNCLVRALNLAEKEIRLDVFLGGVMLTNDVPYKHHGPYIRLSPGTMSAAAFLSHTGFRLYGMQRLTTRGAKAYTIVITGSARKGSIWLVEDAQTDRPRSLRLVNAAPGVRRATFSMPGTRHVAAAYMEATPYALWPAKGEGPVLHTQYANEKMRVRIPERLMHTSGAHSVYLLGTLPAPPEALVLRDGPEY